MYLYRFRDYIDESFRTNKGAISKLSIRHVLMNRHSCVQT